MEADEVLAFLKKRAGVLDGVAVTGGEPLLHPGLAELLGEIKGPGLRRKARTRHGTFPLRLREIVEAGLVDRVAMDIKAAPENYARLVGLPGFDIAPVRESAEYLMGCGADYEFRTTAVKGLHTDADFEGIADWIAGAKEYYIQEFKDSGDLIAGEGPRRLHGRGRWPALRTSSGPRCPPSGCAGYEREKKHIVLHRRTITCTGVKKRDGELVDFNIKTISDAIKKAFEATSTEYNESVIDFLALKVTADFQDKIADEPSPSRTSRTASRPSSPAAGTSTSRRRISSTAASARSCAT